MDHITLKNFRCFRGEQVARLAALPLLVGENSNGKTTFPHKCLHGRTSLCRT